MAQQAAATDQWLRRFHPSPNAATLVCFPHAGGSASYYFPFSRDLAPEVDVLVVQYPGRQERHLEPVVRDIHQLADRIATVLTTSYSDRPLAFFGHSMGAIVAYEVGLRMGQTTALFVSGRRAPGSTRRESVHLLDDAGVIAEIKALSGTGGDILDDEEMVRLVLPAVRGDYEAIETYRHRDGHRLTCPVTVLVGDSDPRVTVAEAERWREHTTGPCRTQVFPGGHFYLNDCRQDVVATVRAQLAALDGH